MPGAFVVDVYDLQQHDLVRLGDAHPELQRDTNMSRPFGGNHWQMLFRLVSYSELIILKAWFSRQLLASQNQSTITQAMSSPKLSIYKTKLTKLLSTGVSEASETEPGEGNWAIAIPCPSAWATVQGLGRPFGFF